MEKGDFIEIEFTGKLENGETFDLTSEELAKKEGIYNKEIEYGPIIVVVGEGFIIKGLDEALEAMSTGEEKETLIEPEKAFGKRDPKLIRLMPEKIFKETRPRPGMVVDISGHKGRIQSVSRGRIRVDLNHPLSGKKLFYKIKILRKITDIKEKIEGLFKFFRLKPKIEIEENKVKITIEELNPIFKEHITNIIKKYTKIENIEFLEIKEEDNKTKDNE